MATPTEQKDYSHRTVVQKLGVRPDDRVEIAGDVGSALRRDVKDAVGRGLVRSGDLDGAIVLVESLDQAEDAFADYRPRLRDTGYLWLITHKRGQAGYVDQMKLVPPREACRPDRQQDLLDRRRALRDPLRGAAGAEALSQASAAYTDRPNHSGPPANDTPVPTGDDLLQGEERRRL